MCLTTEEAMSCAVSFDREWSGVAYDAKTAGIIAAFISHLAGRLVYTEEVLDLLFAAENVRQAEGDLDRVRDRWQRERVRQRLTDAQADLETKARIVAGEDHHEPAPA